MPGDETRRPERGVLRITWVGHSTVLIELDGVRLLTDPVLRNRLAHLRRVGARADAGALRGVDAVLISHLHYDHLDVPSLQRLGPLCGRPPRRRDPPAAPARLHAVTRARPSARSSPSARSRSRPTAAEHAGRRTPFGSGRPRRRLPRRRLGAGLLRGRHRPLRRHERARAGPRRRAAPVAGWGARLPPGISTRAARPRRCGCSARASPCRSTGARTGSVGLRRDEALRAPAEEFAQHARRARARGRRQAPAGRRKPRARTPTRQERSREHRRHRRHAVPRPLAPPPADKVIMWLVASRSSSSCSSCSASTSRGWLQQLLGRAHRVSVEYIVAGLALPDGADDADALALVVHPARRLSRTRDPVPRDPRRLRRRASP